MRAPRNSRTPRFRSPPSSLGAIKIRLLVGGAHRVVGEVVGFAACSRSLQLCTSALFVFRLALLTTEISLIKNNLFSLLSSRPGRPPKRGVPFPPMSPQDAMLHLKQTMQHNGAAAAAAAAAAVAPGDPFKEHYGKGIDILTKCLRSAKRPEPEREREGGRETKTESNSTILRKKYPESLRTYL